MQRHYGLIAAWMFAISLFFFWLSGDYSNCGSRLTAYNESFALIAKELRAFALRVGRYPSTDEGFTPLLKSPDISKEFDVSVRRTLASTTPSEELVYVLSPFYKYNHVVVDAELTTLVDTFDVPLCYENRQGKTASKAAFATENEELIHSWLGVLDDGKAPKWWCKVDEGIFIYSLGSKRMYENGKHGQLLSRIGWFFLALVPLFLVLRAKARKESCSGVRNKIIDRIAAFFKWLLIGIAVLVYGVSISVTCYIGGPARIGSTSGLRDEHDELLDTFVSKGLVKAETAEKLKMATRHHRVRRW